MTPKTTRPQPNKTARRASAVPIHVPTLERKLTELRRPITQVSADSLARGCYVSERSIHRARKGQPLDYRVRCALAELLDIPLAELEIGPEPQPQTPAATDQPCDTPAPQTPEVLAPTRRWTFLAPVLALACAVGWGVLQVKPSPTLQNLAGVDVQPGEFQMGSSGLEPHREPDEGPVTQVFISAAFWMKATEVTQAEWEELFAVNPSTYRACGPDCPVTDVSWWDAVAWCNRRSQLDGYTSCYELRGCTGNPGEPGFQCERATFRGVNCSGYRLPTEAEWEYAARAGTTTTLYQGSLVVLGKNWGQGLDPIAWYGGNSRVDYSSSADCSTWAEMEIPAERCGVHPVAQKEPNAWGIYDVLGNVAEWTTDAYKDHLPGGDAEDPVEIHGGPDGPYFRALRGGGWDWDAQWIRIANRAKERGSTRQRQIGFRPVRSLPTKGPLE